MTIQHYAYYSEHDPYAARWLINLIGAGHIAPGIVDQRSISDVTPNDLKGFTQCHFFAGIGIWSHALRRAGVPDEVPVWTGSCPCQPFSAAGKGAGVDDERHLWPHWHHLIRECRPERILIEQVASQDGLGWLDLVSADLEGEDYAFAAADLCAAGFAVGQEWEGAEWLQRAILSCPDPVVAEQLRDFANWSGANLGDGGDHLRQRLYGYAERLADSTGTQTDAANASRLYTEPASGGTTSSMAHTDGGNTDDTRPQGWDILPERGYQRVAGATGVGQRPDADRPEWLLCNDPDGPRWRPVEPGTFPLADAATARVGRLRAYGNGLDAETATRFVEAVMYAAI